MGKIKAKTNVQNSTKKIKNIDKKVLSEEQSEFKRLIIIVIVVLVFISAIYFITVKFVVNKNKDANETETTKISYDTVSVGMIFNRPYDEYYVVIYDFNTTDASYLEALVSNSSTKEDSIKAYSCDLSNSLNSKYASKDGKANTNAKSIEEFSFGETTLLHIKNGKVVEYIDGTKNVIEKLNK